MLFHEVLFGLQFVGLGAASSILFRGATIIAWNDEANDLKVIRDGSLLVNDDVIAGIFTGEPPELDTSITEVIDSTNQIITPGFIDTHRHGWNIAWRTMASNNTMWDYFRHKVPPRATSAFEPEDIYIGQLTGTYEALNAGVTTMLNWAQNTWNKESAEAGLRACVDSGARVFYAYVLGHQGYDITLEEEIDNFRAMYTVFDLEKSTTKLGIASDSFGGKEMSPVIDLIRSSDVSVVTTHLVQGPYGVENTPELFRALDILNTSTPVVFSHGSFLDLRNYQLLRSTNQYISLSPETEHSTSQTNPTAHLFLDQASLGIDEFFTSSTDILTQARILLQHIRQLIYNGVHSLWQVPRNNPMSANQAFILATRNGGLALRRPDLGVIKVGAKADLVVWDGTGIGLLGWVDPVAAIIQHANVGDIEHVLVDGVFKKRNKRLTVPDLEDIKARFLKSVRRIQAETLKIPRVEPAVGESWSTGAKVVEAFSVDVVRGEGTGYGPLWLNHDSVTN